MYKHTTEAFGAFTKHILFNEKTGNKLAILPEYGGIVLELQLKGVNVVDAYQTPQEVINNSWSKNTVLYPFPNRLKDGSYHWAGKTHRFFTNESLTNTALHGFGQDKPMKVTMVEAEATSAAFTCLYTDYGTHEAYPFRFSVEMAFTLADDTGFTLQLAFRNHDEQPIPAGLGWHPYFTLGPKADAFTLQMPECSLVGIDERMLPTGKTYEYDEFSTLRPVGITVLDNCFALPVQEGKAEVVLQGELGTLHYWQETGTGKYNFLQVFIPPLRHCIALEPMTCAPDAFNNGMGLARLEPGEMLKGSFGVWVEG
ncbi:aldose 1-epimerase [Haliscomenobacter hydrossis]|uniref:Aldose 1-epimerase n=1 Tax=Haliscomenobacter hydrossis (strain ATCC 27775 / DSM 1100 / LMG 10767 / O) TaxID=760192 RepID=F4KWR5_HALH1|nr:aldose 1-epimerase [Haliscomenobacter hydrossis]AEE52548.1 Aldose 1-epimerase [Haliscomenobacter hydrossis DSM 1100]